ncbi:MAG: hypothetical protein LBR26_06470 [Prevotella sp.]|jgi:hypothetical protein|nr:hypothetical protein [Prevotella sp.]
MNEEPDIGKSQMQALLAQENIRGKSKRLLDHTSLIFTNYFFRKED